MWGKGTAWEVHEHLVAVARGGHRPLERLVQHEPHLRAQGWRRAEHWARALRGRGTGSSVIRSCQIWRVDRGEGEGEGEG